ncbi:MAG: dTMP kinase [Neisseria sp.]|nr:dTMP kinase [Neisseria sp.]
MNAQFITLDGIDGAGKTTNLAIIKNWFEQQNFPVIFTREPGGTKLGEQLRQILLNPETQADLRSETLLMFAARAQHISEVILPALQNGVNVVCDRFTDATFAYQGGGRGLPFADIEILENWVQGDLRPDLTILLDLPLEIAMQRVAQTRDKDRFEQEESDFFARVHAVYHQRVQHNPKPYSIINSAQDLDSVKRDIEAALAQHFQVQTAS